MAVVRAMVFWMIWMVSWHVIRGGIGCGLWLLFVCLVVMRRLSVMMGSVVLSWVRSHMVNICSTPFLSIVYAWSSRRRFVEVRGMHFQGRALWSCWSSVVASCVLLSSWSRALFDSLRYCCGAG